MRLQSCCAACCVRAAWQPSSPCMGHYTCRAADDQRQTMLAALMTNEARERCKQPAAQAMPAAVCQCQDNLQPRPRSSLPAAAVCWMRSTCRFELCCGQCRLFAPC